jgi:hypothetical protein
MPLLQNIQVVTGEEQNQPASKVAITQKELGWERRQSVGHWLAWRALTSSSTRLGVVQGGEAVVQSCPQFTTRSAKNIQVVQQ